MNLTRMLTVAATALSLSVPLALAASSAAPAPEASRVATASHRAVAPAEDHTRLPSRCKPNEGQMPSEPLACYLNTFHRNRPTLMLWGDSHGWMFIPALKAAIAGKDVNLVAVVKGSCPPIQFAANPPTRLDCYQFNKIAIDLVRKFDKSGRPFRLVLGASWQRYLAALRGEPEDPYVVKMSKFFKEGTPNLLKTLGKLKVKTDVIGQVGHPPETGKPDCPQGNTPYVCKLARDVMLPAEGSTRTWVKNKMKSLSGTPRYVDVNDEFCDATMCDGKIGGVYTFFDDLHLSATFSKSLKPFFTKSVPAGS
ncbi:MAG: hypothetical protein JWO11_1912 [Nocardioides sp.]|nr:hypothetical protein [Nocardioides sp.]